MPTVSAVPTVGAVPPSAGAGAPVAVAAGVAAAAPAAVPRRPAGDHAPVTEGLTAHGLPVTATVPPEPTG
ncbi:hypothetical protein [Streptomyces sp. BBFR115]|uniref:hypothetical protein n=1 Tax=Streptomyces sp. BBFR115 TaxID=3448173 RepID=UPI003F75DF97